MNRKDNHLQYQKDEDVGKSFFGSRVTKGPSS